MQIWDWYQPSCIYRSYLTRRAFPEFDLGLKASYLDIYPLCWRCKEERGTYIHKERLCKLRKKEWLLIFKEIGMIEAEE